VRPAQDLNWLITNFVERVPSVAHAIVVSADGLPMAFSRGFPADRVDQLAAVTSGLTSLTQGAARVFEGGAVTQTVVEMQRGLLIIMAIIERGSSRGRRLRYGIGCLRDGAARRAGGQRAYA
jgi:predicted regulator of Ras-like GTPase activity (Roadblock/LC7/MglB family)